MAKAVKRTITIEAKTLPRRIICGEIYKTWNTTSRIINQFEVKEKSGFWGGRLTDFCPSERA